jgi:hypothetical protein
MKRLLRAIAPLAVLAAVAGSSAEVRAQYPVAPYMGNGCSGPVGFDWDPFALMEVAPNWANYFPQGGWTLYYGEPGSGVPSWSSYSQINGLVPPAVNAQGVLDRLKMMGIPIIPPEPQFLGKNPRVADKIILPTPKAWKKPEEEKADEPKKEEPPKKIDEGKKEKKDE